MTEEVRDLLVKKLPDMFAWAMKMTKDRDQAEDLVQQASLRILKKAHQFEKGTTFGAWCFTVMKNVFLSERRLSTIPKHGGGLIILSPDPDDLRSSPVGGDLRGHAEVVSMRKAFLSTEGEQRRTLTLIGLGYTYEEIAAMIGADVGTIKSRVSRTRKKINRKMES